MEKVINSYECLFIVDVANGEDVVKAKVEKFTGKIAANAEIVEVNEWGKRRLAYPINDKAEGHYVIVTFKSEPAFIAEIERRFNIDETIMRYLVVKLDFDAAVKAAEKAAAKAAEAEAVVEEAPAAEENAEA
jgi:small subunit ribosomal protein S6